MAALITLPLSAACTALTTGVTWCFCTATASLLGSCCGNDKPSTVPPSATSGRKRSVFLLLLAIVIAFAFQYGVAPALHDASLSNYVTDAWTNGCDSFENNGLQERCARNAGAFRAMSSATLFFVLAAAVAACKPSANREAWPAKYVLFIFLTAVTVFIPNEPVFSDIYLQIARIGATLFIIFDQVIIVNVAYNWNESWVTKANVADNEEEDGAGKKWLGAILFSCILLFIGSIVAIGLLFHFFWGCQTNDAFIIITLVASILLTAAQLAGEEASLLTSASVVAYATFLCYTAVTKNPDATCNPKLGEQDALGIVLGIGLTFISLAWIGWSFTAHDTIQGNSGNADANESLVDDRGHEKEDEDRKVAGVVANHQNYGTNNDDGEVDTENSPQNNDDDGGANYFGNSWKLNCILALVSCWIAMTLTGWGSIDSGGNAANPEVGKVTMWMIIASQWLLMALYLWSLVAPRLFPDRDFS